MSQRKGLRQHVSSQGPGYLLLVLVFHATEGCVDVRIVRLEPVPEGSPQHARSRSRRPSLHHIVFAIEEIRGIAGVKGHRHKSGKRLKFRSRPFPPVAHQIVNAKRARPFWMRSRWCRIPLLKIKIAVTRAWRTIAPRKSSLAPTLTRSISRPVKLRFAGQLAPEPLRICRRFRVAYVYRPIQRQANLAEHRTVHPQISVALPKGWMPYALFFFPLPRFFAPQRGVLVSAGLNKTQEILIRDVATLDRESRHVHSMRMQLVVPAEFVSCFVFQPQRRSTRWYLHQAGLHPRGPMTRPNRPTNSSFGRQPVQHVSQRLGMH